MTNRFDCIAVCIASYYVLYYILKSSSKLEQIKKAMGVTESPVAITDDLLTEVCIYNEYVCIYTVEMYCVECSIVCIALVLGNVL